MNGIVERAKRLGVHDCNLHQMFDRIEELQELLAKETENKKQFERDWLECCDKLAESQAREKVRRDALKYATQWAMPDSNVMRVCAPALVQPSDDTALRAALKAEREFGQLQAAERILEMWKEPWPVSQMNFIDRLKLYVEELK